MAWQLVVSPTNVGKHFKHFRERWRAIIELTLSEMEDICHTNYLKYTNKQTGRRIRSEHISKMLYTETKEIRGTPRTGDKFTTTVKLKGTEKWMKIAAKQEVGGIIRPTSSQLLTIPNLRAVKPGARARMFPKARWANIGGTPFLVRGDKPSKPKVARKPMQVRGRRPPRQPRYFPAKDILFIGAPYVRLKEKRFFQDSMTEAAKTIEREFPKKLKDRMGAFVEKV